MVRQGQRLPVVVAIQCGLDLVQHDLGWGGDCRGLGRRHGQTQKTGWQRERKVAGAQRLLGREQQGKRQAGQTAQADFERGKHVVHRLESLR